MSFSDNLVALRKEFGLTQQEIADKLGFAKNTISAWEKGRSQPNIDILIKLAQILKCSVSYLVGEIDDFGNISFNHPAKQSDLPSDEKELLKYYRLLGVFGKETILAQIKAIADIENKNTAALKKKKV